VLRGDEIDADLWASANRSIVGRRLLGHEVDELVALASDADAGIRGDVAAHVLSHASIFPHRLRDLVERLLDVVDDTNLPAQRRGHAAEGVGNQWGYTRCGRFAPSINPIAETAHGRFTGRSILVRVQPRQAPGTISSKRPACTRS